MLQQQEGSRADYIVIATTVAFQEVLSRLETQTDFLYHEVVKMV